MELEDEKKIAMGKLGQLKSENQRFDSEIGQFSQKMAKLSEENKDFE
jgi:hypothetical protein